MIIMYSVNTNNLFGNPNMITTRQKTKIPMNSLNNLGSKIADGVGEIPGSGK